MKKRVVFIMTWDLAHHCIWSTAWLDCISMLAPGLQQLSWEVASNISTPLCFARRGCVATKFTKSFWYEINRQLYPYWWSILSCWKCHCVPPSMLHIFFNPIVREFCRNIGQLISFMTKNCIRSRDMVRDCHNVPHSSTINCSWNPIWLRLSFETCRGMIAVCKLDPLFRMHCWLQR